MNNNLMVIEHKEQRVLTTQQLAECYNTETKRISENYNSNKSRYNEGIHYFKLEGEEKRNFLNHTEITDGSKNAQYIYLWTEKGALLHAKSLNTDKAWEVYDILVDTYFKYQQQQKYKIPSNFVEALRLAAELEEEKQKLKEVNQILLPKAENYDKFLNASNCQTMNEVAKVLGVGRNKLFEYLRNIGILMENNTPYQRYMNSGYFVVKESTHYNGYREIVTPQTFVTTKGLEFIESKINKGKKDKKKNAELALTM